jgi:mono/diheme cytochrome c family protein
MASKDSTWHITAVKVCLPLLLATTLAGCPSRGDALNTDGAQIFQQTCATCHGPDGKPSGAMVARLNVRDLTSTELRARISPALVENQVRDGSQNKLMPAFGGALTDDQIKAVAAYVASPAFVKH